MEKLEKGAREVGLKSQSEFLSRLYTIPLVSATLSLLSQVYNKAKSSVWFVRKASDWMEYSWRLALGYADPLIHQLSPIAAAPLAKVDNLASKGLATLERTVPAIKKQPSEIVSDTKEMISVRTRPAVERLNNVSGQVLSSKPAQLSCDVVEKILSSGSSLVNNVLPPGEKEAIGFPHDSPPADKSARASWLLKESYYFLLGTTQRLFGVAQNRVDSAVHAADSVVNSVRKTL